jgi:hypothetical protein
MRRFMISLVVVAGLAGVAWSTQAGDEAQAILDKAHKAHQPKGGDDNKNAYHGKNKGTIYVAGLELEFTQEIWAQAPKFKEVMEMSVMNTPVKTTTVFNGKDGWIKVNDMDIPVKDELLDEFKEMADMMGLGQFKQLKDKAVKLTLLGEAQVNGKPAVGVTISKEGKKDVNLYFDKTTGLLAKTERRARDFQSGQEVTEERIVNAYHEVAGRMVAKRVTVNRDGKKLLEADVLEAHVLEKLDDSEFAQP